MTFHVKQQLAYYALLALPHSCKWINVGLQCKTRWRDTSDPGHFATIRLVSKCPDSLAPVSKCLTDTSTRRHWYLTVSTSSKHFCYNRRYRRKVKF